MPTVIAGASVMFTSVAVAETSTEGVDDAILAFRPRESIGESGFERSSWPGPSKSIDTVGDPSMFASSPPLIARRVSICACNLRRFLSRRFERGTMGRVGGGLEEGQLYQAFSTSSV